MHRFGNTLEPIDCGPATDGRNVQKATKFLIQHGWDYGSQIRAEAEC